VKYLHRWPHGARLQLGLNVRWVRGPLMVLLTPQHRWRFRLRFWKKPPIISGELEYIRRDLQLEAWTQQHEMHAIMSVNDNQRRSWRCYTCHEQFINMGLRQWQKAGWTEPSVAAEALIARDVIARRAGL
jgi:hypothetical protein